MMNTLGIVLFALALTASIVFHEAGHFVTARHYGMKASKFFVGFGPTLWSFKKGETEYGVKGFPIGGFVKIEGMTSLDKI
nr:site-2 protease family protein [Micromonospora sp. DSM 115978]